MLWVIGRGDMDPRTACSSWDLGHVDPLSPFFFCQNIDDLRLKYGFLILLKDEEMPGNGWDGGSKSLRTIYKQIAI